MSTPYTRISLGNDTSGRPLVLNVRTRDMLNAVERRLNRKLTIVQGSYRAGNGAAASAGTHDGGGVVDIRTAGVGLDAAQTKALNRALRDAGFASWIRDSRDGMGPHIHAIAIGDKEMASGARSQVTSFDAGRNGLRSNGKDRNSYRPDPRLRFSYAKGKPVPR
jgi:hypothetical protein